MNAFVINSHFFQLLPTSGLKVNMKLKLLKLLPAFVLSALKNAFEATLSFLWCHPLHPNTFILLWTLTFHNSINSCGIILIFRFMFRLTVYQIPKVKVGFEQRLMLSLRPSLISCPFYRSDASFWVFASFTFCLFGCFSQSMSAFICALLIWHLSAWMESTNRNSHSYTCQTPLS